MSELANVKVGDKLAYNRNYGGGWGVVVVAKVGKVHVVDTTGNKYRMNGVRVGDSGFSRVRVRPMTPRIEATIAAQNAREYITRDWSKLTDGEALAVAAAMQTALKPAPPTRES